MALLYFDPGTGVLIGQFLAAGVAGVLMFYKTVKAKVRGVFGLKDKPQDDFMEDPDFDKDEK